MERKREKSRKKANQKPKQNRKHRARKYLAGLVCLLMSLCLIRTSGMEVQASSGAILAYPSTSGALHVDGTKLKDKNNNTVQLKGMSTHGMAWFPDYVNSQAFASLKSWGANVVRLAMYSAEYNGYCTGGDTAWLKNLVKTGVQAAKDNDMYVIIDWHILSDGDPNTYKSQAKAFFSEMASLYKDYNNVIYEICNEPNGGTSWASIKSYASEIIPVIKSQDPDALILVGTPTWSQDVDQAAADPITGYSNIMYTLHFYAGTHKADLQNKLKNAVSAGLPVFVSEFGICNASGNGGIDIDSANTWISLLDSLDISYVNWSLCNKDESASMLNSSCTKTSGWSTSDLSASGKWMYEKLMSTRSNVLSDTWVYDSIKKKWWYRYADGSWPAAKWLKLNNKWYHFDSAGWMQTGWICTSSHWYYLDQEYGHLYTNTFIGEYYVNGSGEWDPSVYKEGWVKSGSRWWYRYRDGSWPESTWKLIRSKWYYFDEDGWMAAGWIEYKNNWYYLDPDSGAMVTDTVIDGWIIDSDGIRREKVQ